MGNVRDRADSASQQHGSAARTQGNTNGTGVDRELARAGYARSPDDIPKQDTSQNGRFVPGNVDLSLFRPSTDSTKGAYRMLPSQRPSIRHDNGFLRMGKRAPAAEDYVSLAKWKAMLEIADALRPDLTDGIAAYRHFLEGRGKPWRYKYERYVVSDASAQETLRSAILEFQWAALELWESNGHLVQFPVTGPAIPCGADAEEFPHLARAFPYPATENWQKAIGAHTIWLSGEVKAWTGAAGNAPLFEALLTINAEDCYNFNPGMKDIATGIEDSENGAFERTGLAHQFMSYSSVQRWLRWTGLDLGVELASRPHTTRLRQPANNRRARNRI